MKPKIYILVEVTYDYYRFQENLYASTDKSELIRLAQTLNDDKNGRPILPIHDYEQDPEIRGGLDTVLTLCAKLNDDESKHYWIQAVTNVE